jgi:hypothetical protein
MRQILFTLICSLLGVSAFAEQPTEDRLQFSWLTYGNFQKLTAGEQDAVIASTRDTLSYYLHAAGEHKFEACIQQIPSEELVAIKNAAVEMSPESDFYNESASVGIAQLLVKICIVAVAISP